MRFEEYPVNTKDFLKYSVTLSDQIMVFYKSDKSNRWWMELTNNSHLNNKIISTTLLACTEQDYLDAMQDKIPERWYNAIKRT